MNSHSSTTNRGRDYCDSQGFKEHHSFFNGAQCVASSTILRRHRCLQSNWLKVDNPQTWYMKASAQDKINFLLLFCLMHEGLFYYTLTNITPALRSTLRVIMLLAVVKTSHIDEYGIDVILEPFVEEMSKLESLRCVRVSTTIAILFLSLRRKASLSLSILPSYLQAFPSSYLQYSRPSLLAIPPSYLQYSRLSLLAIYSTAGLPS